MRSDDRLLVERCQAGDLSAFEPLVEKYRQRVWRLAYNVLRDREEAWDVAQDAFIRAYQALPSFRGQSAFYTWLFRIVMNLAADRARQRAARGRAFGTERVPEEDWERFMTDQDASPDSSAAQTEDRERIIKALDTLSDDHRTIIMLSDVEGLSYREIAEVLDIPIGTVMSRLHNARKRLRGGPEAAPAAVVVAVLLAWGRRPSPRARPAAGAGGRPAPVTRPLRRAGVPRDRRTGARRHAAATFRPSRGSERYVLKLRQLFRYQQYHPLQQMRRGGPDGRHPSRRAGR